MLNIIKILIGWSGVLCSIAEELPFIGNIRDLGVFAGVLGGEVSEVVGV